MRGSSPELERRLEPLSQDPHALVDHLFRREAGKMVSTLVRILGLHNLELAEEVVQETLCRALEVWKYNRIPTNPAAWLMLAAKNRAIDTIRRQKTSRKFSPELAYLLDTEWALVSTVEACFLEHEIRDDQLRMMFSCCHPQLSPESQIMLILKMLCGFSAGEIASAFLATVPAVEKRLTRARALLEASGGQYGVSEAAQIAKRIESVHRALYLLFNEGYHSSHTSETTRQELCSEAMRLTLLLAEHQDCALPETHALMALMCLHAARLASRVDDKGCLILLAEQDRSCWDRRLIDIGFRYLDEAGVPGALAQYHLEAAIAAEHCVAESFEDTDWKSILVLYDLLLQVQPSPIIALNRAIVVGQIEGPDAGLAALGEIDGLSRLSAYRFLSAAAGDFHRRAGRPVEAAKHLTEALRLTTNASERRVLEVKLAACGAETS